MRKIRLTLSLFLLLLILNPIDFVYAINDAQTRVDTIADPHSQYTAKYDSGTGHQCTAILISSTVAITAKHCGGSQPTSRGGTVYPGESGLNTPFGYMNISTYIPHPKYDLALLKGTMRDQSKAYKYYIKKFETKVNSFTDEALFGLRGLDVYSYGYPYQYGGYKQYRSEGEILMYERQPHLVLRTSIPTTEGQSGSGVFLKDGRFVGIIITRTPNNQGNVLPFTDDIAQWINNNKQ